MNSDVESSESLVDITHLEFEYYVASFCFRHTTLFNLFLFHLFLLLLSIASEDIFDAGKLSFSLILFFTLINSVLQHSIRYDIVIRVSFDVGLYFFESILVDIVHNIYTIVLLCMY